jgi:hypothetical protein
VFAGRASSPAGGALESGGGKGAGSSDPFPDGNLTSAEPGDGNTRRSSDPFPN